MLITIDQSVQVPPYQLLPNDELEASLGGDILGPEGQNHVTYISPLCGNPCGNELKFHHSMGANQRDSLTRLARKLAGPLFLALRS